MSHNKKSNQKPSGMPDCKNPSVQQIPGQPESAWELINRYGTYEVQPSNDSENEFPAIAQGLPTQCKNQRWTKEALFESQD